MAAAMMAGAPAAQADAGSGCIIGSSCLVLFYNSYQGGSSTSFRGSNVADFAGYKFLSSGAGQGQAVKNNAASATNDSAYAATIFYNSNYGGACDKIADYSYTTQLHNTYNENASFKWNSSRTDCYVF
ncbi:peptidase inhibitor family I36 protein [Streptomyces sp. NPDC002896]|uniref:peptidase inhibitor family I36 protein n=1 Tax=Streptomyces sp. NPDC002896 TaxID=3154438 RepID=UPI00331DBF5F